jgi:multiple RNA-binding domain-containing protein 1
LKRYGHKLLTRPKALTVSQQGIQLDAFASHVPRSQTIILVKNIPYGTTINTLTDLFSPHGEISRVLLPPAGTLGVVEFPTAEECARAFKALAYRRIGNSVIYLEKGPIGMFKETAEERAQGIKDRNQADAMRAVQAVESAATQNREEPEESDEKGSTLFLKNLSFATTSERLATVLSSLPGFSFTRVQTKPDPKRPGQKLSMGYGFVGFKTRDAAQNAFKGLQGFEVDGHALEVKFAQRGGEAGGDMDKGAKETVGKSKTTKMMVKNLPFEATRKEVKDLFRYVSRP